MSKAVVLSSGGQDSTTCLYWALTCFDNVECVSFDYGQRHIIELNAARDIAKLAGVKHTIIAVPSFRILSETSLVSDLPIGEGSGGLPTTFLPGRNIVFLAIAAGYAAEHGISDIVTGICQTDYSGYPDCREAFRAAMQVAISLGTDRDMRIHAPLMWLTKGETVRMAKRLSGCWDALALSHTCYNGVWPGCGKCPACLLRQAGFNDAGEIDPVLTCTAT